MSQTIAFLVANMDATLHNRINDCAAKFDLFAFHGLEEGDEFVIPGMREFLSKQPETLDVVYLATEGSKDTRMAYEVYEETVLWRSLGKSPRLFPLLRDINRLTAERKGGRYFLACGEWAAGTEAVYLEGSVENLIDYIGANQTLGLWLWSPATGQIQGSDRYPLIFRFV